MKRHMRPMTSTITIMMRERNGMRTRTLLRHRQRKRNRTRILILKKTPPTFIKNVLELARGQHLNELLRK